MRAPHPISIKNLALFNFGKWLEISQFIQRFTKEEDHKIFQGTCFLTQSYSIEDTEKAKRTYYEPLFRLSIMVMILFFLLNHYEAINALIQKEIFEFFEKLQLVVHANPFMM